MQISDRYIMRIPAQDRASSQGAAASVMSALEGQQAKAANAGGAGASASHQSLNSTLSASALNSGAPLSRTSTTAGIASPALSAAMSKGVVNPADWLSTSDKALFEKTTGQFLKDGRVVDKDGNDAGTPETAALINTLFEMRNFGTFGANGRQLVNGDISADDLRAYMNFNRGNTSPLINMGILNKALDTLTSTSKAEAQSTG